MSEIGGAYWGACGVMEEGREGEGREVEAGVTGCMTDSMADAWEGVGSGGLRMSGGSGDAGG